MEEAAARIGLYVNAKITEYVCYKQNGEIKDLKGTALKEVEYFTYLGSNISSTEKDVMIRIAKAWSALNRFRTIWKSSLPDNTKRTFFRAVVESVLIYGSTAWTLTKHLEDKLDGTYTRMLRAILNKSWKQHPTNDQLYGNIPKFQILSENGKLGSPVTAGEVKMNYPVTFFFGFQSMDIHKLDDLANPTSVN